MCGPCKHTDMYVLTSTMLTTPLCLCKLVSRQVLKQKRLYETQRDQLYNQQFNVEQTAFVMENVQDSVQTVQAMKAASKELRTAFKKNELNISGIEKLQDDMADLMVCLQALGAHPHAEGCAAHVSVIVGAPMHPPRRRRICTTTFKTSWAKTTVCLTTLTRTICWASWMLWKPT